MDDFKRIEEKYTSLEHLLINPSILEETGNKKKDKRKDKTLWVTVTSEALKILNKHIFKKQT